MIMGPPCSFHFNVSVVASVDQSIATAPVSRLNAPYFAAFVASSWRRSASPVVVCAPSETSGHDIVTRVGWLVSNSYGLKIALIKVLISAV